MQSAPVLKDIVLIGGGHAHVFVLKSFGMTPIPGVRLTLIARDIDTPYSGMLPGYIAGHYTHDECHIDLLPLARFANARLIHAEATGIDRAARLVQCRDHPPISYDTLSIDIGSTPAMHTIPGADEFATPVKPITRLSARWQAILDRVKAPDGPRRFVSVGGGAAGVEVTLAMHFRLRRLLGDLGRDPDELSFAIVTRDAILSTHNASVQQRFSRILSERGIGVHANAAVTEVRANAVVCEGGLTVPFDELLWMTQAGAAPWLADTGLELTKGGFIAIGPTLQTATDPDIFAAGDVATSLTDPRPKAGVFAVRQGPPLTDNLRRAITGRKPEPFKPQREFLSLISTGDTYAVASRGRFAAEGAWLWTWKDHIDVAFMHKFQRLPDMSDPGERPRRLDDPLGALDADEMRCGGCGAKISAAILSRVMRRLDIPDAPSAVVGLSAPDDAAVLRPTAGLLAVQTVDFFRSFVSDPYIFGRIAANHALGDVYAMGATPRTALAIAMLQHAADDKTESDLYLMLRGSLDTFAAAGVNLIGGHTAEGAEMALGFTVNGEIAEAAIQRKSGARPGDSLILTKPLGTGIILAGEMRGKARGRWHVAAIETMLQSSAEAADCLTRHDAHAVTDVTGFGLAGHLLEVLKASNAAAELDLNDVPLLDGALELASEGVESTMAPANATSHRQAAATVGTDPSTRYAILNDPQTAGGLLAALPEGKAAACVDELHALGYAHAAVIGRVIGEENGVPRLKFTTLHKR